MACKPPFEGYDEFAHYSSLRQIAHTASLPTQGASYLDKETTDYRGPMPTGSGAPPPHAQLGAVLSGVLQRSRERRSLYPRARVAGRRSRFQESQVLNWQAQHPPLYYVLMTPVVWATDHLSLVSQIFFLRLVSYLLAIGGCCSGLHPLLIGQEIGAFQTWPAEWVSSSTRCCCLNSSGVRPYRQRFLCLLLLGCLLYLIVNENMLGQRIRKPWLIGLVLGCGLLTKAFFLPVTAAPHRVARVLPDQSVCGAPCRTSHRSCSAHPSSAVGGMSTTSWSSGHSRAAMRPFSWAGRWMLRGLQQHFSLTAIARGLATIPVTWVWAGTWSLARMPTSLELPVVLLALWVVAEFLILVPRDGPQSLMAHYAESAGLCFGLADRALQGIARRQRSFGGWYLHILMPWVAIAMGRGIWAIFQRRLARTIFFAATFFALAFHPSPCGLKPRYSAVVPLKGDDKLFNFSTRAYCLDQTSLVFGRLGIVAWPGVAVCAFAAAIASGWWLYHSARKSRSLPC